MSTAQFVQEAQQKIEELTASAEVVEKLSFEDVRELIYWLINYPTDSFHDDNLIKFLGVLHLDI